jgi:membrane protein YqaA with SNARE-associated domain
MIRTPSFILLGIREVLERLRVWLVAFGPLGLFGLALIDSAGIPLPGGPDAAMILLSASNHSLMLLYALCATIGSTIGCTVLYLIARRAGIAALKRVSDEKRARIENLLGKYDLFAITVPAILPPPFPFKPFVLTAGVFNLRIPRFVMAVFIGRSARFLIEGWLAIKFGEEASEILRRHGLKVLIVVAGALLAFGAFKLYRNRSRTAARAADDPGRAD